MNEKIDTAEIRFSIAERFLKVIEQLIEEHRAHNYRDIERLTSIEHQRINAIKSFVLKDGRPAYPNIEYLYSLQKAFNVSIDYIISGQGDVFKTNVSELDESRRGKEELGPAKSENKPESILELIKGIKGDVEYIKRFF